MELEWEGITKFLLRQGTDPSKDIKQNILEFLQETLYLLLHFITTVFHYLSEKLAEMSPPTFKFLQEKLPLLLHIITAIFHYPSEKLAEISPPIFEFLQEKLPLLLHFITAILNYVYEKLVEISPPILEFLEEKLILFLDFVTDTFTYLSDKLNEILPPETRAETLQRWGHITLTVILPVSLVAYLIYFCCKCCCRRGGRVRMMKAPGRRGARMARATFEASPRDYFKNLRAN